MKRAVFACLIVVIITVDESANSLVITHGACWLLRVYSPNSDSPVETRILKPILNVYGNVVTAVQSHFSVHILNLVDLSQDRTSAARANY